MTIGSLCLTLALPAAIYSILVSIVGTKNSLEKVGRSVHLVTLLVSIASIMLIFAFVTDSFNIEYVYLYSSHFLPVVYKLSGIWAGLDGSLLFWVWLLAICASIVAVKKKGPIFSYVNAVLQVIVVFFLTMLVFDANPFAEISPVPEDGRGLNPLLQNFFMLIHPPLLYIGYVGFSVPFAYVIADLLLGRERKERVLEASRPSHYFWKDIRAWTIASWLFLTAGNLLGAMWAYVELGWGGFWAWDPVENAGVMPWFTATAFLHSLIIQERRGMFKMWNVLLIIFTFLLTIFGTFITRSGIIQSVHSFSDMTIGLYFIVFMAVATLFSLILVVMRRSQLRSRNRLESIFSREGLFCINSLLFIFTLVAILWGTMLPLFAELFTGQKMEVGPPFFNRVMAPIGIAILFLTGIGPEFSWRKWRKGLFKREFLWPSVAALIAGIIVLAFDVNKWFPLLVSAGAVFVIATIFDEFLHSIPIMMKKSGKGFFNATVSLFNIAPRRYGGYVIHLGVVFLFIGIAGSAYKGEYSLNMIKGEKEAVAGYELMLNSVNWLNGMDNEGVVADVSLIEAGKVVRHLKPALFLHKNQPKPIAEVDLYIRPFKDVYLALGGISEDEKNAEFTLTVNPLISFVWLGGFIMVLGTILAMSPARRFAGRDMEEEFDIELKRANEEDFK